MSPPSREGSLQNPLNSHRTDSNDIKISRQKIKVKSTSRKKTVDTNHMKQVIADQMKNQGGLNLNIQLKN